MEIKAIKTTTKIEKPRDYFRVILKMLYVHDSGVLAI